MTTNLEESLSPSEKRRAEVQRERAGAIEALRDQIQALEEREPELKQEIAEFEKTQRATVSELEKTQRTTIAELEKTQRATIAGLEQTLRAKPDDAEELEQELEQTRAKLEDELESTRTRLEEELERTRTELNDQLTRMRDEFKAIRPSVIDARCKLGMKMSDYAIEEHKGHEQAIEYLQPLLVELRNTYSRVIGDAKRVADEADEALKTLEAEHHHAPHETLPLVEQRFEALIDAEGINATIAQAKARVARHRLELVDPDEEDSEKTLLARELELEAARDELDAARATISALLEDKKAALYHYGHPRTEKSKALGKQLGKRFARHHTSR